MSNDYFKTDKWGRLFAGQHVLLDLYDCDGCDDPVFAQKAIEWAAVNSGAHVIESRYHSFGDGHGYSGMTLLAESHISIHTWPEKRLATIDIFMCGKANPDVAAHLLINAFQAKRQSIKSERRGEDIYANPWGQQLILDLKGCPENLLKHKPTIRGWCAALVDAIDMRAYGDPIVEHFAEHSPEAAGYTLIQLIETSNIAAHFAENVGEAYIDILSCKPFREDFAIQVTKLFFQPQIIEKKSIRRG